MNMSTKHYTDDELVLLYYGETEDPALDAHLADCPRCRAAWSSLERVFAAVDDAPVPERGEDYGRLVWQRVEARATSRAPRLDWRSWFTLPRLSLAGAMAALLLAAFFLGRGTAPAAAPLTPEVRERILLVAVGDHLERSQRLLVELANTDAGPPPDFEAQQAAAGELVRNNRIYRQTALRDGDPAVAALLDELERLLLDIANTPAPLSGTELADLRRRIEQRGILMKIRVIGGDARRVAATPGPAA